MFDFKGVEEKWKKLWYENNLYQAIDFSDKPKKYILAELPYPSGKFLHAGHMMRYTVPDIYSRFLRMRGFNVLFPMGWDSFGLPAETFALKEKITPQEAIKLAVNAFRPAMQSMGYGIDWDREINTCDPSYYKWTQWTFLKIWEQGLAEIKEMPVWFCKELGVLADEEVLTDPNNPGKKISERGSYPVDRKMTKQWVLKLPKYGDKLLEGLSQTEFPEAIKNAQISWIDKSVGLVINYPVVDEDIEISCFTTRADTNFGATFIVLSPEHSFAKKISENNESVRNYIDLALSKSDVERMENKEKSGVFTGFYALNRLTNKKMPIYVGDYVLGHYGTGSIVGVPAHDNRDLEFATKFTLEVLPVYDENGKSINSDFLNGLDQATATDKITKYIVDKNWGHIETVFKVRDQIWSRQRYWGDPIPLIHTQDGGVEANYYLPVIHPEITEQMASESLERGEFPSLDKFEGWADTKDSKGMPAKKETETMPTWAGSNWYYMRYIDPKNDKEFANYEKLKYWLPVDHYFGGAEHTTVHLLYTRFWYKALRALNLVPTEEPFKKRTNGGLLLGPDGRKMSKRWGNVIDPREIVENYGADACRTYLAFLGPYTDTYPWDNNGIKATYRFIYNVYALKSKVKEGFEDKEIEKAYHKMVKVVSQMCEDMKMNTAVPEFMKFYNLVKTKEFINRDVYLGYIKCIAPFAPFTMEDIWQEMNGFTEWKNENSIHVQVWPTYDDSLTSDDELTIGVQINGKLRGEITILSTDLEEAVKEKALKVESVQKHLDGKEIKKFIYIAGRVVNIVI